MNVKLQALVRRIWQRAYLDTEEECARWIEEYIQSEQSHKHGVSESDQASGGVMQDHVISCPSCGQRWDLTKHNACSCGAQATY